MQCWRAFKKKAQTRADRPRADRCIHDSRYNNFPAERLTPSTLGTVIALYEHRYFTQGAVWRTDAFDQWGVDVGKVLVHGVVPELDTASNTPLAHHIFTNALITRYRRLCSAGPPSTQA